MKKCPTIFKYIYKENGGHGSVINYAVHNLIKTKYFMVVDGDDYVNTDKLYELVKNLYEIDSDIVITDYNIICRNVKTIRKPYDYADIHSIEIQDSSYQLHNVIYKTKLWVDNKILLTEKVFYEDNQYCLYPRVYCKSVTYVPFDVYNYVLGSENQSVNPASVVAHRGDLLKVLDDILLFSKKLNLQKPNTQISYLKYMKEVYMNIITNLLFII